MYPVRIGAAIPEIWHTKINDAAEPCQRWPRGAINAGIDQPTGAAAASPPIDRLIQNSARIAVCACAAPKMPEPKRSAATRTTLAHQLAFHPADQRIHQHAAEKIG